MDLSYPCPQRMRYNVAVTEARSSLHVDKTASAQPGVGVFAVSGELDLATIGILRDVVGGEIGDAGELVVLDLSDLSFCDSTGLGTFVGLHRQAISAGTRLALAAPRKRVADLLQISGINQVVPVFESVDAAVLGRS